MSLNKRNEPNSHVDNSRVSQQKRGRTLQSNRSKPVDSKTIKSMNKKSQKVPANNVKNTKPQLDYDKYHSQGSECISQTKQIAIADEDKKTQHLKPASKSRKNQIQEELEQQEKIREGVIEQSGSRGEEKIKITSRFRKLVLQREGLMKMMQASNADTSMMRREEKQYGEIANDINLNNLQSKVIINIQGPIQKDLVYHSTKQEESLLLPSPEPDKKEFILHQEEDNDENQELLIKKSKKLEQIQELQSPKENPKERSILNLNSDEEEALQKSILRAMQEQSREPVFASTRQIEINFNGSSKQEPAKIDNNLTSTVNRGQLSQIAEKKKRNKAKKLDLASNTVCQKVEVKIIETVCHDPTEKLEEELQTLRKAVRQLRLQKVKAKAEKESLDYSPDLIHSQKAQNQNYKTNNEKNHTLIAALSIQTQSRHFFSTQKSEDNRIAFGRIRKNKASTRESLSFEKRHNKDHAKHPIINISKLSTNNHEKVFQSSREERRKISSCRQSYESQYRTLNLQKINEQNVEESNINQGHSMTLQDSGELSPGRSRQICEKVLTKFESSDKKFHTFLIREHSKSRSRVKRYIQGRPNTATNHDLTNNSISSRQWSENNQFQGTIVKNIVKPIYQSLQFLQSHSPEAEFLNPKIISLIDSAEKKGNIKRNIEIKAPEIPYFPKPPSRDASTEEIMNLILKILPLSDETYNEKELVGCSLKKYKNCIMFQLPDNSTFRVVWHFAGKIYIGEWDSEKNQKSGEGIEYLRNKYYYKGQFSRGKRYGKGLLITPNGSYYEGEFIDGEKHGRGKYFDNDDKSYYEGGWRANKMEGKGYLQYENNIYQGNFKQNYKNSFGHQLFSNGDKYYGEYSLDKFNGQGKYAWTDRSSYIGSFKDGYRHQYGKWISSGQPPEIYTGFYSKDKKQGRGRYIWNNGCVYEGNFDNDVKNGIGSIQYPDGRYMEGKWVQGILSDVISKLAEAHVEEPLQQPKFRGYQTHTKIKVMQVEEQ